MENKVNQPPKEGASVKSILLFVSGIGLIALAGWFLLLNQSVLGNSDSPVVDVQITPADVSSQRVNQIIDEAEISGAIQKGEIAPTFYLDDHLGNQHSLESLRGQPVIVNFWATWCAPCRVEMPEFEEALGEYADENLIILGVNREEDVETVEAFFAEEELFDTELGTSFIPLFDSVATVADAYGVFNMPTTYFINADGVVTDVHRGPLAKVQLDQYMTTVLE